MKNRFLFAIIILVLTLVLSGCRSPQEKVAEKSLEASFGNEMEVDIGDGGGLVKVENKETGDYIKTDAEGKMQLPDSWPSELKICNQCQIISVINIGQNLQVVAQADIKGDELKTWYGQMSQAAGWAEENAMDMGEMWIGVYKKDGQQISYTIAANEDGQGYIVSHAYTAGGQ